jgi:hypothetical protein
LRDLDVFRGHETTSLFDQGPRSGRKFWEICQAILDKKLIFFEHNKKPQSLKNQALRLKLTTLVTGTMKKL